MAGGFRFVGGWLIEVRGLLASGQEATIIAPGESSGFCHIADGDFSGAKVRDRLGSAVQTWRVSDSSCRDRSVIVALAG